MSYEGEAGVLTLTTGQCNVGTGLSFSSHSYPGPGPAYHGHSPTYDTSHSWHRAVNIDPSSQILTAITTMLDSQGGVLMCENRECLRMPLLEPIEWGKDIISLRVTCAGIQDGSLVTTPSVVSGQPRSEHVSWDHVKSDGYTAVNESGDEFPIFRGEEIIMLLRQLLLIFVIYISSTCSSITLSCFSYPLFDLPSFGLSSESGEILPWKLLSKIIKNYFHRSIC